VFVGDIRKKNQLEAPIDLSSLIILTDLDGTLLDHHTYSYEPALGAIKRLKSHNIPIILISSKTREEIQRLQKALGIDDPFVCENGAAIHWRGSDSDMSSVKKSNHVDYQSISSDSVSGSSDSNAEVFSVRREIIVERLQQIRKEHGFDFTAFSDLSTQQLAALTGLPQEQALLASRREYTEPLQWHGSEAQMKEFMTYLAETELKVVKGGRFYSVMGKFDKCTALEWLRNFYGSRRGDVKVIALGDSPNDERMLDAADIAVVVHSEQSAALRVEKPGLVVRTEKPGPEGWAEALDRILDWGEVQ